MDIEIESPWQIERKQKKKLKETKQDTILLTAAQWFAKKGYHGTSMDDIAYTLKISKPTLYKYYTNKGDLLHACHEKAISRFRPIAKEASKLKGSTKDKIRFYFVQSTAYMVDPFGWALTHVEETPLDETSREYFRQERYAINKIIENIIRKGIKKGEIRGDIEPRLIVFSLFGAFNLIPVWYRRDGTATAEEIVECYLDIFFDGLSA